MDVRGLLIAAAGAVLLAGCASGGGGHASTDGGHKTTGGSVSSSSGNSPTAPMTTTLRTFTPYSASGQLTVPVARRVRGHCWETSLAAPAANDYRCLAANQILDPCFVSPAGHAKHRSSTLACFTDPWSKAVQLHVRRLPKAHPLTRRPWAVVLTSGQRCVAVTGTSPFVAGVGLDYWCGGGEAVALRNLHTRHVTALVGHVRGSTLRHISVQTIWRG
jgi:hypothetical protein